jgi:hypothetical protein
MRNDDTNYDDNPFLQPEDPKRDFFPYENVDFAATIEVLDQNWTAARYTRKQRIRFNEDGVTTFFDFAWGEGVLFANYNPHSMRIIDAFPARKGYIVALALPRKFYKGEVFEVVVERKVVGAFFDELNYWESTPRTPTGKLAVDIIAPRGAGFRSPELVIPPGHEFHAAVRGKTFQMRMDRPPAHAPFKNRAYRPGFRRFPPPPPPLPPAITIAPF